MKTLQDLINRPVTIIIPNQPPLTATLLEVVPDTVKGYVMVEAILDEKELEKGEVPAVTVVPWQAIIALTQASVTVRVPAGIGGKGIILPGPGRNGN